VALWREGLLARAVLRGRTRGYRHHPQLARFRAHPHPVAAINSYLEIILAEAELRGYSFDAGKIRGARTVRRIAATRGQLEFEWQHLLKKLERRARIDRSRKILAAPRAHPLFRIRAGPIESWEVQRDQR
jgi:pyrimidine dimer DNA glycosylase